MLRKSHLTLLLVLTALAGALRAQTIVLTPSTTTFNPAGGTLTFTTTITYTSTPAVLAFSTTLPTGWTYLSTSGPGSLNSPTANTTGTLNWFYTPPTPSSPATFNFTVSYPAGLTGLQPLSTSTVTRTTTDSPGVTTTGPTLTLTAPPSAFTWSSGAPAGGDWTTAANWSPNGVPNNSGLSTNSAQINSGTPTISSGTSITLNTLLLLGGTLNNLGTLTLADTNSSWSGGVITGAGQLVNASGAQLTASGTVDHDFNQQAIVNQGQFTWSGSGNLRSGNGGSFTNSSGAVFTDSSASGTASPTHMTTSGFAGNFTFNNAGTYVKSGTGETKIEIPFTNSGSILVNAGNLHFDTSFTINGGVIRVASGATTQLDLGLNLASGKLIGGGTVLANVTSGSFISPGDAVGQLTITGNLTLLGTSQLIIDLGGTSKGTTYDFLSVSGTASLGGTLSLNFTNNFRGTVSSSDTFTVLSATSLTGAFTNAPSGTRLQTTFGQGSFLVTYTGNSVVLSNFDPIPEPSTWALLVTGTAALALVAWRRRKA